MWGNATNGIRVTGLQAFIGSAAYNSDKDASTASMRRLRMGTLYKNDITEGMPCVILTMKSGGEQVLGFCIVESKG